MPGPQDEFYYRFPVRFRNRTRNWPWKPKAFWGLLIDEIFACGGDFGPVEFPAWCREIQIDPRTAKNYLQYIMDHTSLTVEGGRFTSSRIARELQRRGVTSAQPLHNSSKTPTKLHTDIEVNQADELPSRARVTLGEERTGKDRKEEGAEPRPRGNGSVEIMPRAPEPEIYQPGSDEHLSKLYKLAGKLKRRSAVKELQKLKIPLDEIENILRMAESAAEPRSYLAKVIENKRRPPEADPRHAFEELFE